MAPAAGTGVTTAGLICKLYAKNIHTHSHTQNKEWMTVRDAVDVSRQETTRFLSGSTDECFAKC